jgi:hypothetical protein
MADIDRDRSAMQFAISVMRGLEEDYPHLAGDREGEATSDVLAAILLRLERDDPSAIPPKEPAVMAEESRIFRLVPGSEFRLDGSPERWSVLAHIDRVVLLRRIES